MQLSSLVAVGIAAIIAAGCASQGATTGTQRNVITAEELERAGDVNLYEALNRFRPTFLRSRTPPNAGVRTQGLTVYVGDLQMMEGLDHLREIAAKNVKEVRFLEPHQANARFGGNNTGGALVILMK
jgi:hypothetical protein